VIVTEKKKEIVEMTSITQLHQSEIKEIKGNRRRIVSPCLRWNASDAVSVGGSAAGAGAAVCGVDKCMPGRDRRLCVYQHSHRVHHNHEHGFFLCCVLFM
jgi:hypothetical protein